MKIKEQKKRKSSGDADEKDNKKSVLEDIKKFKKIFYRNYTEK